MTSQVQPAYNTAQTNAQYALRNSVLPGMIDGNALLTSYGNNPASFGVGNSVATDVFPYSVDVGNLAYYNQLANAAAASRSDVGSLHGGNNQVANTQNQAVTSLTGYNNKVSNTANPAGASMTGYLQAPTTAATYTGVTLPPGYNQLGSGVNNYNYGGVVTGSTAAPNNYNYGDVVTGSTAAHNNYNYGGAVTAATGLATTANVNPYVYKLIKRQSGEIPMDLMTADTKRTKQLPSPPAKENIQMDKVFSSYRYYTF